MQIFSYLATAVPGREAELALELTRVPGCRVIESDSKELLILVTETASSLEEEALQRRLEAIESLAFLAMVYGHDDREGAIA